MYWFVWWFSSAVIFVAGLIVAFVLTQMPYKRKRMLTPNKILVGSTFLSSTILLFPIYLDKVQALEMSAGCLKSFLLAIQHAIKLFASHDGYLNFFGSGIVTELEPTMRNIYSVSGLVLYFFAPLLTISVILSFFKNLTAYRKYFISFWKTTHVFSELNERSLALAKSIILSGKKKGKKKFFSDRLIVFSDVSYKDGKIDSELIEEAKELGAVLFSKNIESIKFRREGSTKRKLGFYLMSQDEDKMIRQCEYLINEYDCENVELRVFSDCIKSELLLSTVNVEKMKIIRVNDISSLIYHNLDVNGMRLFQNARIIDGKKTISAVIVGLGKYGLEMLKALSWFCQMDGYDLKIKAYDKNKNAKEIFENMCPELMSDEYNGKDIPGEARYNIEVKGGIDINSADFYAELSNITDATYIFVCLGSDVDNLSAAVEIRSLTERVKYIGSHKPDIETVIYDSGLVMSMSVKWSGDKYQSKTEGVSNFKDQFYNIHMIGDISQVYSCETLLDNELINKAEEANADYAKTVYDNELKQLETKKDITEEDRRKKLSEIEEKYKKNIRSFYKYEYNYYSTIARKIHEKKAKELSLESPELEHKRWNAYMRSIGYQYSRSQNEASRNDLAKLHHNLVSFDKLDKEIDVPKDNPSNF